MSKYEERIVARKMREQGFSIIEIYKKLKVSKSSVSLWCRDISLSKEQIESLNKNKGISSTTGRRLGAETNRNKKIMTIKKSEAWARHMVKNVSRRALMFIGLSLYWCEGSKTDTTSTFMFVNSDPEMILIMKKFLINIMGVSKADLACRIQINEIHRERIAKVLNFWEKLLELDGGQMKKPYFVKTSVRKIYENYDNYFGVCRLFVLRGKQHKYKILGLIKAAREKILSA